jgi:transcriptional regulator with XRE-family HTH domain
MTNHLRTYFREQRDKRGLGLGQLARLIGCRNVSKGSNRIARLEREEAVPADLLLKLAGALGIDLPTAEDLLEQDHQERLRGWEQWVSQPVPMRLVVRYLPAVYGRVALPEGSPPRSTPSSSPAPTPGSTGGGSAWRCPGGFPCGSGQMVGSRPGPRRPPTAPTSRRCG